MLVKNEGFEVERRKKGRKKIPSRRLRVFREKIGRRGDAVNDKAPIGIPIGTCTFVAHATRTRSPECTRMV